MNQAEVINGCSKIMKTDHGKGGMFLPSYTVYMYVNLPYTVGVSLFGSVHAPSIWQWDHGGRNLHGDTTQFSNVPPPPFCLHERSATAGQVNVLTKYNC